MFLPFSPIRQGFWDIDLMPTRTPHILWLDIHVNPHDTGFLVRTRCGLAHSYDQPTHGEPTVCTLQGPVALLAEFWLDMLKSPRFSVLFTHFEARSACDGPEKYHFWHISSHEIFVLRVLRPKPTPIWREVGFGVRAWPPRLGLLAVAKGHWALVHGRPFGEGPMTANFVALMEGPARLEPKMLKFSSFSRIFAHFRAQSSCIESKKVIFGPSHGQTNHTRLIPPCF